MAEAEEEKSDDKYKASMKDAQINKIAVLFAMLDEAKPLIEKLKLKESKDHSQEMTPFTVYTNEDNSIFLVVNGKCLQHKCDRIGTQWSTLSAYLTIHKLKPDIIINAGTCGGIVAKYCFDKDKDKDKDQDQDQDEQQVNIADVFIGQKVIYSDRRVPLPQWKVWAPGHYQLFAAKYLSDKIEKLKLGKCFSSSNAFDFTKEDQETFEKEGVVCKDMECAAIAEFCTEFGCKLIALKAVTDLVQHHDEKHFLENLIKTVNVLADVTELVIKEINGKKLSDLE